MINSYLNSDEYFIAQNILINNDYTDFLLNNLKCKSFDEEI